MVMKAVQGRPPRACMTRIPSRRRINILLATLELTQTSLADDLGIDRQYLNAIITGRKRLNPDNPILDKIAKSLGQSVDDIFPLVDLNALADKAGGPPD